jgi:hypothetical protein
MKMVDQSDQNRSTGMIDHPFADPVSVLFVERLTVRAVRQPPGSVYMGQPQVEQVAFPSIESFTVVKKGNLNPMPLRAQPPQGYASANFGTSASQCDGLAPYHLKLRRLAGVGYRFFGSGRVRHARFRERSGAYARAPPRFYLHVPWDRNKPL